MGGGGADNAEISITKCHHGGKQGCPDPGCQVIMVTNFFVRCLEIAVATRLLEHGDDHIMKRNGTVHTCFTY
jgi:hypothetical protein